MPPAPVRAARALIPFLPVLIAVLLSGCGEAGAPAPTPESDADRALRASTLYRKAQGAPIPEKYELFRRLIALYGETAAGRDGFFELVVSLTHDRPPRLGDALSVAKTFRERHPTDVRVAEAFREVADTAYGAKDDEAHRTTLAAWEAYLVERDLAGDLPKGVVFQDLVRLRLRQSRWEDAEVAIDTALAEPAIASADRVELLVRKGSLLAEKLGRPGEGRAAFEQALALARRLRESQAGRPGIPPEQIEAEIRKLGG
jgi:hypothetical protein